MSQSLSKDKASCRISEISLFIKSFCIYKYVYNISQNHFLKIDFITKITYRKSATSSKRVITLLFCQD